MSKNYTEITANINAGMAKLRSGIPEVMKGFSSLAVAASAEGSLDKKTKELIALGIGVAGHCDGCIGFHVKALVKLGQLAKKWKKPWVWRCIWVVALR
jgi:AhpD family alkylhydroperoxidase